MVTVAIFTNVFNSFSQINMKNQIRLLKEEDIEKNKPKRCEMLPRVSLFPF